MFSSLSLLCYLARQEKLLQGLMTEIIRMTSQMQPLEVGVPLYPFSHSGLFARNANGGTHETGAPLPNGRTFEDAGHQPADPVSVTSGITSLSTPPMAHTGPAVQQVQSANLNVNANAAGVAGWNARLSPMGRVVMPSQSVATQSSYPH